MVPSQATMNLLIPQGSPGIMWFLYYVRHTHLPTHTQSYISRKLCSNIQHVSFELRSHGQALWMCYLIQVIP